MKEIQEEFRTKKIEIDANLSNDVKDLIRCVLRRNPEQRFNIKQVLSHPAITNRIPEFEKPITEEQYSYLIECYMQNCGMSNKRDHPEEVKKYKESHKNVDQNFFGNEETPKNFFDDVDHLINPISSYFGPAIAPFTGTDPGFFDFIPDPNFKKSKNVSRNRFFDKSDNSERPVSTPKTVENSNSHQIKEGHESINLFDIFKDQTRTEQEGNKLPNKTYEAKIDLIQQNNDKLVNPFSEQMNSEKDIKRLIQTPNDSKQNLTQQNPINYQNSKNDTSEKSKNFATLNEIQRSNIPIQTQTNSVPSLQSLSTNTRTIVNSPIEEINNPGSLRDLPLQFTSPQNQTKRTVYAQTTTKISYETKPSPDYLTEIPEHSFLKSTNDNSTYVVYSTEQGDTKKPSQFTKQVSTEPKNTQMIGTQNKQSQNVKFVNNDSTSYQFVNAERSYTTRDNRNQSPNLATNDPKQTTQKTIISEVPQTNSGQRVFHSPLDVTSSDKLNKAIIHHPPPKTGLASQETSSRFVNIVIPNQINSAQFFAIDLTKVHPENDQKHTKIETRNETSSYFPFEIHADNRSSFLNIMSQGYKVVEEKQDSEKNKNLNFQPSYSVDISHPKVIHTQTQNEMIRKDSEALKETQNRPHMLSSPSGTLLFVNHTNPITITNYKNQNVQTRVLGVSLEKKPISIDKKQASAFLGNNLKLQTPFVDQGNSTFQNVKFTSFFGKNEQSPERNQTKNVQSKRLTDLTGTYIGRGYSIEIKRSSQDKQNSNQGQSVHVINQKK